MGEASAGGGVGVGYAPLFALGGGCEEVDGGFSGGAVVGFGETAPCQVKDAIICEALLKFCIAKPSLQ